MAHDEQGDNRARVGHRYPTITSGAQPGVGGGAVGCRHFRNMGYCGVTDFLCSGKTRTVMFGVPSYCLGSTNTEMGSGELAKTPQNDVKYPCSGPGPN